MNYEQYARYYDIIHAEQTADIDFVLSMAAGAQGSVLELGCGTGRFALPLARAGCTVVGIDNSTEMLAIAREKQEREPTDLGPAIRWLEGDLTNFQLQAKFDLVTVSHNTFHEFDRKTARVVLRQIQRHLKAGGMVYFDLSNPLIYFSHREGDNIWVEDKSFLDPNSGSIVHQRSSVSIDPSKQQIRVLRVVRQTESDTSPIGQYTHESTYHLIYPHEVDLLMREAGLQLMELFGNYDRKPFGEGSERMIVVARSNSASGS